jgi:EpsI family protein
MKKQYFFSLALILIGGILGNVVRYTEKMPERPVNFENIPKRLDGYTGSDRQMETYAYDILKADTTLLRDYTTDDGSIIELFIAYFNSQKYGSQIHSPKNCLPGGGWRIEKIQPYVIRLSDGSVIDANKLLISVSDYKAVMLYWYETRSGIIRSEYGLKLDLVRNALLFRPTDAAIIRVTIPGGRDDLGNSDKIIRFIQEFYPYIKKSLPF